MCHRSQKLGRDMQIDTNAEIRKIFAQTVRKTCGITRCFTKIVLNVKLYNEPLYSFDEYMNKNKKCF